MHLCSLYCRRCWSADIPYCGLHESLNRHPNVLFSMACSCMSLPLSLSFTFTAPQNFSFLTFCPAPYCVSQQCNRAERAPSCVDLRRALQSAWWRCVGYPELHGAMQPRAGWKNPQPRMVLCQKVSALRLGGAHAEGFTEGALSSMRMLTEESSKATWC